MKYIQMGSVPKSELLPSRILNLTKFHQVIVNEPKNKLSSMIPNATMGIATENPAIKKDTKQPSYMILESSKGIKPTTEVLLIINESVASAVTIISFWSNFGFKSMKWNRITVCKMVSTELFKHLI